MCEGNVESLCHLAQLFVNTLAVILWKKSEIVGEFIEISGNMCANTTFH